MSEPAPTCASGGITPLRLAVCGAEEAGTSALAGRLSAAIAQRPVIVSALPGPEPHLSPLELAGCDLAILLVELADGFTDEVRRRAVIASTVGVRHLLLVANNLDLTGWDLQTFEAAASAFQSLVARLPHESALAIPISVLTGDNIEGPSPATSWYQGPALIPYLTGLDPDPDRATRPLRLPIAAVTRPGPDRRHYNGSILSGTLRRGQEVQVATSQARSMVEEIIIDGEVRETASAGDTVAVGLATHIDVSSGNMLVSPAQPPLLAEQLAAHVLWLGDEPMLPGRDYTIKLAGGEITGSVTGVKHRLNIGTLHHDAARTLHRGEIGSCTIATSGPMAIDSFEADPNAGRVVLADRVTGSPIAVGTIDFALRRGQNIHVQRLIVSKRVRADIKNQTPCILWFTGLSGAGKSTIANLVESQLAERGFHTYMLDGDNVRHGLNKDLGFTAADRVENIRRVGEVAKLFVDAGLIVLCSFISPFRAERETVRSLVGESEFIEVYVSAPLEVCEERDPKGLYAKSRAGRLPNFTGIDSPYETPENPALVLDTAQTPADALAQQVVDLLQQRAIVAPAARQMAPFARMVGGD